MKLTEEQYELIEAYLKNELSDTDRESFESDLRADAELQAEVDLQRNLRLGMQALGIQRALERAKKQYHESLPTVEPTTSPLTIVRPLTNWRSWAAAASVIIILGLGYFAYQQTESHQMELAFSTTTTPGSNDELLKTFPSQRLSATTRSQFLDAFRNYEAGEYDRVIEQLKTLPNDQQTIHYKNYFLGLSYLANKQASQAIPLLFQAQLTSNSTLHQKAEWFLALAYVKNNQKGKALPILKKISADKASPYQSLAQKVLAKIQ